MGEAKRRGTREERVRAAKKRNKKVFKHYNIPKERQTPSAISRLNSAFLKLTAKQQKEVLSEPPEVEE